MAENCRHSLLNNAAAASAALVARLLGLQLHVHCVAGFGFRADGGFGAVG